MRKLICALTCAALLAGAASPCWAVQEGALTVRVGFFAFEGYHEQDENGSRSGYGYELLQHLAGYAGLRYEYVGYDKSWSEMQDMLERGEIDLLTSAQKTERRERRFAFSNTNIGVSAAILTVKAGDSRYLMEDYAGWSGMRVGMLENNSRNDSFASFAAEHGFTYEAVYFDGSDDMNAALENGGEIDAILTSNLRRTDGETVLAQFDSSLFYIMVRKGDAKLLERINSAIVQMDSCEPGLSTELMDKYYAPASNSRINLSADESAFIESMSGTTFTALISPDRAPYSYYEDGAFTGIAYEAALEIIRRSGLNIEFAETSDLESYFAAVDGRDAAIRFEIANSYNSAEEGGYWLTVPFITVPMARLFRKGTTSFKTAAEPTNRDIADDYGAMLKGMGCEAEFYGSVAETVEAVKSGERDAAYLTIDTANLAVRNDVTNRLVCEEIFGHDTEYAVVVDNVQSPLLFSILNKAAASIGKSEGDAIRQKYASELEKPFTFIGYMYDFPMHIVIAIAVVLLVALLAVVLAFTQRRRKAELVQIGREKRRNQILNDALESAERAGAAKGRFLSSVSHEMRTPLNAIIGFFELAKGASAEDNARYLASSDIAAKQLLAVINDVLDMSSIESGKLKLASAPFNFKNLISSITNIYGAQCKHKGVLFETRLRSVTEDWLVGDEMRVNQILMNLLGNAVKFTDEGRILLTVSQTSAEANKLFFRFEISDTGCGMSDEMKARLFKPFEQESAEIAQKYGGSGLGLSIVKSLVVMMGGSIRVESALQEGTTFTVDLPFAGVDTADETIVPENAGALRVLAVDDDASELEYVGAVLKRMDVRYTCAGGGAQALAELEKGVNENDPYNVCLVDWRMPLLSGEATTKLIREKYGSDMVVIVVSAYSFEQVSGEAKAAGANRFLSKPVFQSSLFDLFMDITDGEIARAAPASQEWDFTGRRVLLVEDNHLNQIVAKGYLTKFNVAADLAENGKQGVDMFLASEPGYYDAILMDIQMPVMDGFEATRAIRQSSHPSAQTIQIIAQTADAFNEDITKALSLGMNAHVAKPTRPDALAKALDKAFKR